MSNKSANGVFLPRVSLLTLYALTLRLVCEFVIYPYGVRLAKDKFFADHEQAKNIGGRMLAELAWAGGFVVLALSSCIYHKLSSRFSCRATADVGMQQPLLPLPAHVRGRWTSYYIPRSLLIITQVLFQLLAPLSLYTFDNMMRFLSTGDLDFNARVSVNLIATLMAFGQVLAFLNIMRPFIVSTRIDVVGRKGFFNSVNEYDQMLQNRWLTVVSEDSPSPGFISA